MDGTFGVYAVPEDNPAIEYQLMSRFETSDEALEVARDFLRFSGDKAGHVVLTGVPGVYIAEWAISGGDEPKLIETREIDIDSVVTVLSKDKQEAALREYLKQLFKMPGTARFKPFAKITEYTPHLLSYFALIVFIFSISFSVPKWVPILGDWIGGKTLNPIEFAKYFPFLLIATVIVVQVRARLIGLKLAGFRDYVLALSIKNGWRIEQFGELFLAVIDTSGYTWARKLGEWMQKWDPNTLRQIRKDAESKQDSVNNEEWKQSYSETEQSFLREDFEARIHSLYYMDKESNYRPWAVSLYPVLFLGHHRRAIRRLRGLLSNGMRSVLYLALCSLPGGDDYRVHRRMFPYIAIYEGLVFGIPLVWAFAKQPWSGFVGWLGMGIVLLIAILPMLVWNYQLMVCHRGLPRGMSWEEIQADHKFIRAL